MSLWSRFLEALSGTDAAMPLPLDPKSEADKIFLFLEGVIADRSAVVDFFSNYRRAHHFPKERREREYVAIYTGLENYIINHQPPAVTKVYDREELRKAVITQIDLPSLSIELQLIFMPRPLQAVHLGWLVAKGLAEFLIPMVGQERAEEIIAWPIGDTFLKSIQVEGETIEFPKDKEMVALAKDQSLDQIIAAFKLLNTALFNEVRDLAGEKNALNVISGIYSPIKIAYDYDTISLFFEMLPVGVLQDDRATFLSREELERRVAERTQEVARLLAESKRLEKSLKKERDQAEAVVSSMGDGLYVVDLNYRIISLNPVAAKLLGMKGEEVIGQDLSEYVEVIKKGKKLTRRERPVMQTISSGQPTSFLMEDQMEYRSVITGRRFPVTVSITPLLGDGATLEGAVIVFRDITRDKHAAEMVEAEVETRTQEVQEGRAQLIASINSLRQGFLLTDREAQVIVANEAALESFKHTHKKQITLKDIQNQLKDEVDILTAAQQCMASQASMVLHDLKFEEDIVDFYISPVLVDNAAIGCTILSENVTETRLLTRAKDEFLSIASHELRTPLTAIRGNISLIRDLRKDLMEDETLSQLITSAYDSSVRLIEIVNDFLDVSQLEQGQVSFGREEVRIASQLRRIVSDLQGAAMEKGITLEVGHLHKEDIVGLGDTSRVKQVLYNLVNNAVKFTDHGKVVLTAEDCDDHIAVFVKDTGRGVSGEGRHLLFHKLQQAGGSLYTRDTSKGTGLGLYISKLIVEAMGGEIGLARSAEGKGSVFFFTLPKPSPRA